MFTFGSVLMEMYPGMAEARSSRFAGSGPSAQEVTARARDTTERAGVQFGGFFVS